MRIRNGGNLLKGFLAIFSFALGGLVSPALNFGSSSYSDEDESPDYDLGVSVASIGDQDSDGVSELAIGDSSKDETGGARVWVVSPATKKVLYCVTDPANEYVSSVLGGLDLNGDTRGDFVVAFESADGKVFVQAFAGHSGKPIWHGVEKPVFGRVARLGNDQRASILPRIRMSRFMTRSGSAMLAVSDVDGDKRQEVLLSWSFPYTSGESEIVCLSGATGKALWRVRVAKTIGFANALVGDIDGDGIEDAVLGGGAWTEKKGERMGGELVAISVANGTILWTYTDVHERAAFGSAIVHAEDYNGDGVDDLVVGAGSEFENERSLDVLSGSTGKPIAKLDLEGDRSGEGWPESSRLGSGLQGFGHVGTNVNGSVVIGSIRPDLIRRSGLPYLFSVDKENGFRVVSDLGVKGTCTKLFGLGDIDGDGDEELAMTSVDFYALRGARVRILEKDKQGRYVSWRDLNSGIGHDSACSIRLGSGLQD